MNENILISVAVFWENSRNKGWMRKVGPIDRGKQSRRISTWRHVKKGAVKIFKAGFNWEILHVQRKYRGNPISWEPNRLIPRMPVFCHISLFFRSLVLEKGPLYPHSHFPLSKVVIILKSTSVTSMHIYILMTI